MPTRTLETMLKLKQQLNNYSHSYLTDITDDFLHLMINSVSSYK